jgi:hypothetical protein
VDRLARITPYSLELFAHDTSLRLETCGWQWSEENPIDEKLDSVVETRCRHAAVDDHFLFGRERVRFAAKSLDALGERWVGGALPGASSVQAGGSRLRDELGRGATRTG